LRNTGIAAAAAFFSALLLLLRCCFAMLDIFMRHDINI